MYYSTIDLINVGNADDKTFIDNTVRENTRWVDNDQITYVYNHYRPNGNYEFMIICTSFNILVDLLLDHHYGMSTGGEFDDSDVEWCKRQIFVLGPDRIGRKKDIENISSDEKYEEMARIDLQPYLQQYDEHIHHVVGMLYKQLHMFGNLAYAPSTWSNDKLKAKHEQRTQADVIPIEESTLYDEEFSYQDHEDETVGPKTGYEDD